MLAQQYLESLIRRTLTSCGLAQHHLEDAVALLLGTAAVETGLGSNGLGKSGGLYQITTGGIREAKAVARAYPAAQELVAGVSRSWQLRGSSEKVLCQGTVLAYLYYIGRAPSFPSRSDLDAMARFWKRHYNTSAGAGSRGGFKQRYRQYVAGSG